jgi:hypothetical protein
MKSVSFKTMAFVSLMIFAAACAQRKNTSIRVGRGSMSRSSGTASIASQGSGSVSVTNYNALNNFFTNYSNPPPGAPQFTLPCSVSQVLVTAYTDGVASVNGGFLYQNADASGAQLQLDFVLSCVGRNADGSTYNDIQVNIGDGLPGYYQTTSSASGNLVSVSFQDDYGSITLQGQLAGTQFSGQISYSNNFYITPSGTEQSPGFSDVLGSFTVSTCSLFRCM